jgi:hypothetical protein
MISLAPMRYGKVLTGNGGPVASLEYGLVKTSHGPLYQANATLSPDLGLRREERQLYADVDGTGTHRSAMVARYMAISEAMERWAFLSVTKSDPDEAYGFDLDPTSSGMAAFPGLFKSTTRGLALSEAAERCCLVHWWNGCLRHEPLETGITGLSCIVIDNPLTSDGVVIVWSTSDAGWVSYGTAAAGNRDSAVWKAAIEMDRARVALDRLASVNPDLEEFDLSRLVNPMERQMLYSARPPGYREFMERVRNPQGQSARITAKPVVDVEIKGPWSRYATVWRTLFPNPAEGHVGSHAGTFLW